MLDLRANQARRLLQARCSVVQCDDRAATETIGQGRLIEQSNPLVGCDNPTLACMRIATMQVEKSYTFHTKGPLTPKIKYEAMYLLQCVVGGLDRSGMR